MDVDYCVLYDRESDRITRYESLKHLVDANIQAGPPELTEELTSIERSDDGWEAELTTTYHVEGRDDTVETATGNTVFDAIGKLGINGIHPTKHEILVPRAHVEDAASVLADLETSCTHTDTYDIIAKIGLSVGLGPSAGLASVSIAEVDIPPTIETHDVALYCRECHEWFPESEFGQ